MTGDPSITARLSSLVDRLDWVSGIGAAALRVAAVAGAATALACWVLFARRWGGIGTLVLIVALAPAAILWFYARSLDAAVDATKLELSLGDLAGKALDRVGEVRADLAGTGRLRFLRAGWSALASVRQLREDVSRLGVDLAAWTAVANPAMLAVVAIALLAVGGLFIALAAGAAIVTLL